MTSMETSIDSIDNEEACIFLKRVLDALSKQYNVCLRLYVFSTDECCIISNIDKEICRISQIDDLDSSLYFQNPVCLLKTLLKHGTAILFHSCSLGIHHSIVMIEPWKELGTTIDEWKVKLDLLNTKS